MAREQNSWVHKVKETVAKCSASALEGERSPRKEKERIDSCDLD
jgi:hypothetical protein